MQNPISILFCEDSQDDHLLMQLALKDLDLQVTDDVVSRTEDLLEALKENEYDLFIVDYNIPGYHVHDFLDIIHNHDPNASIIVVSGTISEDQVVETLKRGASDYVMKDNLKRLPNSVRNEYVNAKIRRRLDVASNRASRTNELLRVYLENVEDVIATLSQEGEIRYVSPSCRLMYGYSDAEFIEMGYFTTIHSDDLVTVQETFSKAKTQQIGTRTLQYRRQHKDGYYIWVETKVRVSIDPRSGQKELICTSKNITKIKNAESALQLSEKRFKLIVENSSDIFTMITPQGKMLYNSPSFYAILGYTEDAVINKNGFDFLHPQDREAAIQVLYEKLPANGYASDFHVFRFRAADGRWVYFESRASNQLDDPDVGAIVLNSRDITKRVETEMTAAYQERNIEQLSQATIGYLDLGIDDDLYSYIGEQLQSLIPNSIISVNSYNAESRLLVCESLRGTEVLNKTLAKYATQISEGSVFSPTDEALEWFKTGKLEEVEGGLHTLLFGAIPRRISEYVQDMLGIRAIYSIGLVWKESFYGNVIIIALDTTPYINTGVIQTFANVASVALQRKFAERNLVQSLREKEVMLKEIHHRVKNNLQIVSSLLELQAFQLSDPVVRLLFNESQTRVRSMAMVHEKIYQSDDLSNINYRDYIEQLMAYLFESYMPKNIKTEIDADDVMLNIDTAVPLGIIVNELITNSLKYAFPGGEKGTIYARLRKRGPKVELVVGDDGVGLPVSIQNGEKTTLGLELVNALIQQLDAEMEINTEEGTRFTILVDNA
ncbi:MAG: PAS domain S-box protein [Bacteroidetes bacterium]|nr:PAS domain S-box protein [Bacteroidota bacterium]MCH8524734.1 PAS domain S-box protein [Balneolales bacterium]